MTIKFHLKKILSFYRRINHIKYARSLGVTVGENCRFVDNPSWGSEPYLVFLGNHVLISCEVQFINHDGATWVFREKGKYKNTFKYDQINIGDNCFIGTRAILLPGTKIGNDSIIAAGAVVSGAIPSGEVWGGIPAKFIMKTQDYAERCYKNNPSYDLEKLKRNKKEELLRFLHN